MKLRILPLFLALLFTLASCVPTVTETSEAVETPEVVETLEESEIKDDSTFEILFIDVGQADSALILCDGKSMLIDGGNRGDSNVIYTVLKKRNVTHLDYIVATHAHEDHIGGLPGALNFATVGTVFSPVTYYDSDTFRNFLKYVEERDSFITIPEVGDSFELGSAKVEILAVNTLDDTNNTSIVLKITYGETSFLFTGDAEREVEEVLVNSGADLSSTVLKVGHHGSETSTSYLFLREIMPEYAIISVGEGNSYGHPADNTLSRLRDADVKVFRTDLQGDITVTSDGKTVSVKAMKNENAEVFVAPDIITENTYIEEKPSVEEIPTSSVNYLLNTNTKKFHYPECRSAKTIKEENNKIFSGDRETLISEGYSPCGNCNP
ncbi:MAG: MBL fold metallo-hydrolase [Clostridia bacterium]|nr:MBL fold metallo-hydrolase [Clostridia bacterium]